MQGENEIFFQCPYCFESISMLVELYYGTQEYIEDCQVCCSPIKIIYKVKNEEVELISVERGN